MIRRISSTSNLRHEIRLPARRPSAQNLNFLNDTDTMNNQRLVRQKTFVLDKRTSFENEEMASSHEGIATILDLLPNNLKPYISMHFRMIREENEDLLQVLEEKEKVLENLKKDHAKCKENEKVSAKMRRELKNVTSQYEREKAKSRAIIKQLKLSENVPQTIGDDTDLIWYGMDSTCGNGIKKTKDLTPDKTKAPEKLTSPKQNSTKIKYENRSSQTIDNIVPEKSKETEKLLNKSKTYRSQIQSMRTEMDSLRKVS